MELNSSKVEASFRKEEPSIKEQMCLTVPDDLKKEVSYLYDSIYADEVKRLCDQRPGDELWHHENDSRVRDLKKKAETLAACMSIALLIMNKWSPKMRRHAEKLILNKAIHKNYVDDKNLKFVYALDISEEIDETGWVIEKNDDIIIDLLWNKFNMKEHFHMVHIHRLWVQRSYDRLKEHMPSLCPEIIERHDLSKFAFSQAVGYTMKHVHNTYHHMWKTACDLHLQNEPHHPQTWSKSWTPEVKCKKLELWMKNACDFRDGYPYGINLATLDFASEDLAEVFLLESFIDMVAIEWERKKGGRLDIHTRDLVYIEDKFLRRYSKGQHKFISAFMYQLIDSFPSWKDEDLTQREKNLLSFVREEDKNFIMRQMQSQKKVELDRILQHARESGRSSAGPSGASYEKSDERFQKKANDNAYFTMVAYIVMEYWDYNFRKHVEGLILKKAIEEHFIKESHLQWITVIEKREEPMEVENGSELLNNPVAEDDLVKIIWEDFSVREHFSQMKSHRHWIMQSFLRLSKFVPELSEEVIERHDLSKFAFSQAIGYTLKWVHGIYHPIWRNACDLHMHSEPHHPEMWSNTHSPENKKSCLESWLCVQAGGSKYGVEVSTLNLASESMAKVFLYESFLDMVGIEWERKKGGELDLTDTELIYMEAKYLARYSKSDKAIVVKLMTVIREADVKFKTKL
ncbi:uncharacterized protein LOC121867176 [Homarus americanus]|uniref:Uncharacterized protein n=1 Tax=Homarus americanus TaxID=6706 RepID=A0A8J5K5W2_HOMAM|nr:uncharacterized protein LOC121867176 [Homarus americanus]KAG7168326.1 hypothetical protein Hamer_G002350 [Homarus americanus]